MRNVVVAGISVASIASGALALAVTMPAGVALADDTGATTTTAPSATPTVPNAPGAKGTAHAKLAAVRARLGAKVEDIASFLGIPVDQLKTDLRTKSLGEIAGDKKPALVAHLTDEANARIDAAVSAGKLPAEKAATLKTKTAERITQLVDKVGGHASGGGRGPLGGARAPRRGK